MTLLSIDNLCIEFETDGHLVQVVEDVSLTIDHGEFVGLVGESGCGKSMTALATLRLVPAPGRIAGGRIELDGRDLLALTEGEMRRVRGARIGMIFQEPMAALNPVFTLGSQLVEAIRVHRPMSKAEARDEAMRLLDLVALADPRSRLGDYPHQLSGGQRQRAVIAIALACQPDLLLADEPTTALDVTVQAQIIELLEHLRQELGLALLLITHDLSVVAEVCDRVLVMYSGRLVEEAPAERLYATPAHPYTQGLLAALPRLGQPLERSHLPSIPGQVPDPSTRPPGCAFHPRCSQALDRCREEQPAFHVLGDRHRSRCWLHEVP